MVSIRISKIIKKGIDTGERAIEFQGKRRLKVTEKDLRQLFDLLKFHYDNETKA